MLTALCGGKQSARWQEMTEVTVVANSNFQNLQVYLDVIKGYRLQKEINTVIQIHLEQPD